jgi:uncharacterized protein with LGFP repeats
MRLRPILSRRIVVQFVAVLAAIAIVGGTATGARSVQSASASPQSQQASTTSSAATSAAALSGSNFKAGLVISNYLFYRNNAMTQPEIQAFLDAKVATCGNSNCLENKRTTTFDRAADRTVCAAYKGAANELTSTIIFKVQQACGISAKVLLVTLQKEQGLVTKSAPSDAAIRVAMGYGCPDTAPCASQFFGLYNQLYKAAWQFKRYSTPDQWGSIQPGIESVRYSPTASCGTKRVVVENNATAALYNYTPYTPNAAALANLSSVGDGCSAYGNRNFWVYYTTWFGSTLAGVGDEMVAAAYAKAGGASGALGAEAAATTCGGAATCVKTYQHGVVYWTSAAGAIVVSGAIGNYYVANGGPTGVLGIPKGAATATVSAGNGNGQAQSFAAGIIQASAVGSFAISGPIGTAHSVAGGPSGALGWPIADKICGLVGGGCSQQFQQGTIYARATGVAIPVQSGTVADFYATQGGVAGSLGYPLSPAKAVSHATNGNGTTQGFAGGVVYSSAIGSFVVSGSILTAHALALGAGGRLGWPIADKVCELPSGGCSQQFQQAIIYARSAGVAIPVRSATFADFYATQGAPAGSLGYPTAVEVAPKSATNGNGHYQAFARGWAVSSAKGTFIESGVILTKHLAAGGVRGKFGWPVAAQVCGLPDGGCSQKFQRGTLFTKR